MRHLQNGHFTQPGDELHGRRIFPDFELDSSRKSELSLLPLTAEKTMPWMHPGHPRAIKITARRLVYQRCGTRPLGQDAVREAIAIVRRNGWLANYCPGEFEFDRSLILVPSRHRFAALFR